MKKQIFLLIALFLCYSTGYMQELRKVELVNEQTAVQSEQKVVKTEPTKLTDASVKVAEKAKLSKEDVLKRRMERASTKPVLQRSTSSREVIFFEDFEGLTSGETNLPDGWTLENNSTTDDWYAFQNDGVGYFPSGVWGITHDDYYGERDAWAFTPGITLTAGNIYEIGFWLNMPGYSYDDCDRFELKIGATASASGMSTTLYQLIDEATADRDWEFIEILFSPTTTGTYYLGFHAFSENFAGDYIDVDDVEVIDVTPSGGIDGEVAQIITPNTGINLSATEQVKVLIKNNGGEPLTDFDLLLELDGELIATETFTSSITALGQAEYTFEATLNLSSVNTYEITVTAIITGDVDESNNTATKTVTNTGITPIIVVSPNPFAIGTLFKGLSIPIERKFTISNTGLLPLIVDAVTTIADEITVTGLPITIEPDEFAIITLTFDVSDLPTGSYTRSFVLNSNDIENPAVTVTLNGSVAEATIIETLNESWTETTQPGWIYNLGGASFSRVTTGGVNNSPYIRSNIYGTSTNFAIAQTPFVVMGDNPVMSFAFRATNFSGGAAAAATTLSYSVSVSTDGGTTWNTLYSVAVGEHIVSADFRTIAVNVSEYADELCLFRITCNRHDGDIYVSIDDVFIGTAPDYPIIEVLPVAMGVIYNNLPYPVSKVHQIKNVGGVILEVTDIVSSSPEITVTGLPFEVEPLDAEDITVTIDGNGLPTGAWTGNFVIESNDPDTPQKTVDVNATIQSAIIVEPLDENWNLEAPVGWVYNAGSATFSRQAAGGVNNSAFIRANIYGSSIVAIAQTPYIIMGEAPVMSFAFRATDYLSTGVGPAADPNSISYSVSVTNDNGVTWNTIHTVGVGDHIESAEFQTITVNVSDYADELCIFRIICNRHDGDIHVGIDDVRIGTFPVYEYCEPVTNFEVIYNDNCEAVLTWTAPSETDGKTYNVYRNFQLITSELTETTFIDTELDATAGNTWAVTVSCEDGGESEEAIVVKTGCINPYITPDTDTEYTFDDLVTYSSGTVIKAGDIYVMRHDVTISTTDALIVNEDITVKISTGKILTINGSRWEIDAPEQAFFTNYTEGEYYATIRVEEGSFVRLNNATFNYGSGIRVIESDFIMDNCTMNNHNYSSQASGAISVTRGKVIVKNSTFKNNIYPAFSSGANISCIFEIINCYLENNTTANVNRPQINLGASGEGEITKIIGNTIIGNRALTMVGGIGNSSLLGLPAYFLIEGNTIIDNRYGITFTGSNIRGTIKGNILTDNNVDPNPMTGGSGINITASGGNNHAIITENVISGSLWGITLVGNTSTYATGPTANLGNISVPEDDPEFNIGRNIFFNNGNGGELYDLYNNNPHDVMAQNNKWGVAEQTEELIRTVIRDKTDDPRYGTVTFMPPMVDCIPVTNLEVVYNDDCEAVLTWTAPSNADGITYKVYRDEELITSGITVTTYTDTELDIFAGHTWAVTVDCGSFNGESEAVEVTIEEPCGKTYYTVTVSAFPDESGDVEIVDYEGLSAVVEAGISVTIKAIENERWEFNVWKDETGEEISNLKEYTFIVTEDITLTAHFEYVNIIKENLLSNVILYPNPFNNEIYVSDNKNVKSVQITNAVGQKVKQVIFDGKKILTRELLNGIYFVEIESITGDRAVYKMVKK